MSLNKGMDSEMWYTYTMEYYSTIKNDFMKFLGKWMELENILSEVTHSHKKHTQYALTDKWISAKKLGILKTQFTDQMKLKKKEDQSMDTLVPLRRGNEIPMRGDTEIKCGAKTEKKGHPETAWGGIPPIYSY